jgi:glucan biosynthesis protein C
MSVAQFAPGSSAVALSPQTSLYYRLVDLSIGVAEALRRAETSPAVAPAIRRDAMSPSSDRLHGLDAVRGFALLLGVVFHATMSFLPGQQVWMIKDSEESAALSALFFTAHIFRMSTFFLIAGFFGRMLLERRGVRGFLADRGRRIALPLVVFWPIVIAGIVLATAYGAFVATGAPPKGPPPSLGPEPALFFPLTHLWFLYVLLIFYGAALTSRSLTARLGARLDRLVARLLTSPAAPLVLAIPAAAAFALSPGWLAFFGVPTPDMSLIPNLPAVLQYGLAFGVGWLLHRQSGLLSELAARWPVNLAAAAVLTVLLLARLGFTPPVTPEPPGPARLLLAAGYALAIWTWTFAVIGLALRFLSAASAWRRYVADSSYWIYVIHLPLVVLLQAWLSRFDWHWSLKFAAILGIGFAIMFASYELLVRHSFLGAWLNGRRVPWRAAAPVDQPETAR